MIFLLIEYAATKDLENINNGAVQIDFHVVLFALPAVTILGFIIGIIELLFIRNIFSQKSFLFKLLGKLIIYSSFLFIIICLTYPIAASIELKSGLFDEVVWENFNKYLSGIAFLSTGFQMSISLICTLFYHEISEKVGSDAFLNFLTGKYHNPRNEKRIFMFLDMKSSTSIAEKLGHYQYFKLLKEYYNALSEAVMKYSGEIYQYVGDEMIVSWRIKKKQPNDDVLKCFFKMKEDLSDKQQYFNTNYGNFPTFKAGIHCGEVTTGEIGTIKKDVIFTGDTLNTTARLQNLCNELSVDILLSDHVLNEIEIDHGYLIKSLGKRKLKGKKEPVELITITKRNSCPEQPNN